MKTIAIGSIFVLFAIVAMAPSAFADHASATVTMAEGSGLSQDCAETDECFMPYEVTVDVGGEVTWISDASFHTVYAGDLDVDPVTVGVDYPNGFESGLFNDAQTFSQKFEVAGVFPYYCSVHPWMKGIVTVADEGEPVGDHHGTDDETDMMMMMEDQATATAMTSDGYMVSVWSKAPTVGDELDLVVKVTDPNNVAVVHLNHDIMVMQNGETVLEEVGHGHQGVTMHETASLTSDDAVDVKITLQGLGDVPIADRTGPIGEEAVFSNIVPEFGTVAMMILVVSIISIIAVTTKSRVIPRL